MSHKSTPRRTGEMKSQIVRWSFKRMMKVPKKFKGGRPQEVVVHVPPAW